MSKEHKALTGSFASLASGSLATPLWFDEPKHFDPRSDCTAFRTVWICDTHLGTPGCNAELLLDFLRSIDCETLYLVGDIVDGWQLRKGWYWLLRYNDVVAASSNRPSTAPASSMSPAVTTKLSATMSASTLAGSKSCPRRST